VPNHVKPVCLLCFLLACFNRYLVFFAIDTSEQRDCGHWQRPIFPTSGIKSLVIVPGKKTQSVIEDSSAKCDVQARKLARRKEDRGLQSMGKDSVVRLNSTNYFLWKSEMEDHLCCKDLEGPIFHQGVKPAGKDAEEWKITDRKCLAVIRKHVEPTVRNHITELTTAFEAWKKLKDTYESPSSNNKVLLFRKFVYMKYEEGTPMADHLNEIKGIINQLNQMKFGVSDEACAVLILLTLPKSWAGVSTALSNQKEPLSVDSVTVSLLEEEIMRKQDEIAPGYSETVAATVERGRKERKKGDENKGCHYCGKSGHFKRDCWVLKKDVKNNKVKGSEESNLVDLALIEDGKGGKGKALPSDLI
jgi:hypothetical protein